jgi:mycothiol synthase
VNRVTTVRAATWDDFDEVVDLLAARSRAAFGVSQVKAIDVRHRWELPGYERWVASDRDRIVGYVALDGTQDVVHSATDSDVGDALLAQVAERAKERGFDHVSVIAVPEDAPLSSLVERHGFAHDRDVLRMWRELDGELPEPKWDDGAVVRSYTKADGEPVHALLDEAYAGWDPNYVPRSHESWLSFMTGHDDFDPKLFFLVEREGALVACALHWKEFDGRGWVKDIVVRQSERGRGLGTALLHHAFRAYAERGAKRVGLKVDSTNPTGAPQLYKRLGFVIDQRLSIWIKRL